MPYIGELAGITTSLCWAVTSVLFTAAVRRLSPVLVNTYRILVAVVLLGITHRLLGGTWWPQCPWRALAYLAGSGIVGLVIGDQALLTALRDVGPRIVMLIMATAPVFATLFGWLALGETLGYWAVAGMVVTMAGVAWVVLERRGPEDAQVASEHRGRGVLLAFFAAAAQAGGLLLSKQGMGHGWLPPEQHLSPQAATLVRMSFAGLAMLPIAWWWKRPANGHAPTKHRMAGVLFATAGAVSGPFLGVWLSLVATDRAPLGIAQTTMSLAPVLILPLAVLVFHERVSLRAVLGAVVAVGGCGLLFIA